MDVFRPQYGLWMKLLFVSYNLEFASDRICKRLDGLDGLDHDGPARAGAAILDESRTGWCTRRRAFGAARAVSVAISVSVAGQ